MTVSEPSTSLHRHSPVALNFGEIHGGFFRGCIHQMHADPLGFYSRAQSQHGDYVRLRVVRGIHCYLLTHPDAVEHVLHKAHKNYRKPHLFYKNVGLLVGNGLFTNEGESWVNQRRLAAPVFHGQSLQKLCSSIVDSADAFNRLLPEEPGQPIDIASGMMKLGLRIASTTLFSADISGDADAVGKAFRVAFKHIGDRMNSMQMVPSWLPIPQNLRFARAKRELDSVVENLIDSRRQMRDKPADLLTMLLNARDEQTGHGMPERLLRDEVLTLLTAGHENIGEALAWTWYLLAAHPAVQQDLYDEIHGHLHGRTMAYDDVSQLPLLKAVFEESMRLYPPGWGEMRESIEADDIQGYAIPPKAMIILCQWVTHRHPDFWPEAGQFNPARFLPAGMRDRHRFAYFPFGGGPRICIGMQLAMLQGALVLGTVLQRFRIELVAGQRIEPDATFTLLPRYGVKVLMHRRA